MSSLSDPLGAAPVPPVKPRRPKRALFAALALIAALIGYALWANRHDPVRDWWLLAILQHWAATALFFVAALAGGWRVLTLVLRAPATLPTRLSERFTYAIGAGTLLFGLGVFVGGWLGLFGRGFFFAWPALLIAWGGPRLVRDLRRTRRRLKHFGARLWLPTTFIEGLSAAALALLLVAIYVLVMTPENIGWDARWYHLSVAEHYVAQGKIRGFPEGWYLGTYPQLASWLYTWAFQSPGSLFHHALLSAHLEWCLFLAMLPGIAAVVRRLCGTRVPWAAAALVFYPGLILYDSSLIVGADHVLAFWGPGIVIALLRAWPVIAARRTSTRRETAAYMVGLAIFTSGAVLTKYQAIYFAAPVVLVLLVAAIRARRAASLFWFAGASLVLTAPHWLKNLLLHGNPTYPLLHSLFPSHPFHPGAGPLLQQIYMTPLFALKGTAVQKITRSAAALVDFSFIPNDWAMFHGQRPVFGSLFTLLLPALLLVRAGVRLWSLIAALHLGVLIWYVTSHQDRFLQALLPLMAACTAAALVVLWRQAPGARIALLVLLGFQLVWGGDVYFLRTHAMVGDSPLKPFADRMAAGHEKKGPARFVFGGTLVDLGRELPPSARVLVHDMNVKLGIGRPTVVDEIGWQGLFEYLHIESPSRAFALWRKLGVTHALWQPDRGDQSPTSLAREAVFVRTVKFHQRAETQNGGVRLSTLTTEPSPPSAEAPTRIAWLGCGGDPSLGVYSPLALAKGRPPEIGIDADTLATRPGDALQLANAAIVRSSCGGRESVHSELSRNFETGISAGGVTLWIRRPEGGAR
ncbi:MAG TPA: hypothetical protein VGG33_06155 [Polyangia bacterium]